VQVSLKVWVSSEVTWMLIVCSYNKINGSWACENDGVMNKLLKDELGHRGYIMSDWNGTYFSDLAKVFVHLLGNLPLTRLQPSTPQPAARTAALT
jgi:hypothetical protein